MDQWLQSEELVCWGDGTSGLQFQALVLNPQATVGEPLRLGGAGAPHTLASRLGMVSQVEWLKGTVAL